MTDSWRDSCTSSDPPENNTHPQTSWAASETDLRRTFDPNFMSPPCFFLDDLTAPLLTAPLLTAPLLTAPLLTAFPESNQPSNTFPESTPQPYPSQSTTASSSLLFPPPIFPVLVLQPLQKARNSELQFDSDADFRPIPVHSRPDHLGSLTMPQHPPSMWQDMSPWGEDYGDLENPLSAEAMTQPQSISVANNSIIEEQSTHNSDKNGDSSTEPKPTQNTCPTDGNKDNGPTQPRKRGRPSSKQQSSSQSHSEAQSESTSQRQTTSSTRAKRSSKPSQATFVDFAPKALPPRMFLRSCPHLLEMTLLQVPEYGVVIYKQLMTSHYRIRVDVRCSCAITTQEWGMLNVEATLRDSQMSCSPSASLHPTLPGAQMTAEAFSGSGNMSGSITARRDPSLPPITHPRGTISESTEKYAIFVFQNMRLNHSSEGGYYWVEFNATWYHTQASNDIGYPSSTLEHTLSNGDSHCSYSTTNTEGVEGLDTNMVSRENGLVQPIAVPVIISAQANHQRDQIAKLIWETFGFTTQSNTVMQIEPLYHFISDIWTNRFGRPFERPSFEYICRIAKNDSASPANSTLTTRVAQEMDGADSTVSYSMFRNKIWPILYEAEKTLKHDPGLEAIWRDGWLQGPTDPNEEEARLQSLQSPCFTIRFSHKQPGVLLIFSVEPEGRFRKCKIPRPQLTNKKLFSILQRKAFLAYLLHSSGRITRKTDAIGHHLTGDAGSDSDDSGYEILGIF